MDQSDEATPSRPKCPQLPSAIKYVDVESTQMQQEQEHTHNEEEDRGLLDLAWEKQQKKTFTAWCNSHLRKVKVQIETLEEDFRDGLKLMMLLEVISGERLRKPEKGKLRVHHINNVNKALEFVASKGVRLVSIGAEEIVDGNLKMTLGMIWTIILRFAIQDISVEHHSSKEGLLLWCQRKTAPYKNVNVQNFHMSFKDGLAFCALIHRHRPDLINYDDLRKDDPSRNLSLAFDVAEKHLDIPRMLDVEDLVNTAKPDEKAVMTYVSCYYHAFSSSQQAETAAKRINKVLNVNKENERMMEDYENMSSDLLKWINDTVPKLDSRPLPHETTMKHLQDRLNEFREHKSNKKPPRADQKANLETSFNTLQTKLRLSNRPAYMPTEGKMINDIDAAWKGLETSEANLQLWVLSEMRRLEKLDHLALKFNHKCNIHEAWTCGKDHLLTTDDYSTASLPDLLALKKKHEAFESDMTVQSGRLEQIVEIANELNSLGYSGVAAVNERCSRLCANFDHLGTLTAQRRQSIEKATELAMQIDELRLLFAKKAASFNNWMDNSKEDLTDHFKVHSIEEIKQLVDLHAVFQQNMPGAKAEYDMLNDILAQIEAHMVFGNPYTSITKEDLAAKWNDLHVEISKRGAALNEEIIRQQKHEGIRIQFANKANQVGPWIKQKAEKIINLGMNAKGTLEEQLSEVKHLEQEILAYRPNLQELETINEDVQKEMIFENPHTTYLIDSLRLRWEQLLHSIALSINTIQNQILTRDSRGLTEEQIKEYRNSFFHFDKDKSGYLDQLEFRQCLVSLGYNVDMSQDPKDDVAFQRIIKVCDPNETDNISFNDFLNFVAREMTDSDSAEQVAQSFRILARDKPYITADELRRELPPDQAQYCISRMSPYHGPDAVPGALDYGSFSSALYGESDL